MARERMPTKRERIVTHSAEVDVVPREYAGKWVAWSTDGRRIIAVGSSFKSCEQAAARAGFPSDRIAIDRIPVSRQRETGSWT